MRPIFSNGLDGVIVKRNFSFFFIALALVSAYLAFVFLRDSFPVSIFGSKTTSPFRKIP